MNEPWVTVVTVVRNDAPGLVLTRRSVERQTASASIEHVIVDGASTDGTSELARELSKGDGVELICEPDQGIYDAMNKGLALAHGRWVVFLNAGDEWIDPRLVDRAPGLLREHLWGFGRARVLAPSGRRRRVTPRGPLPYARLVVSRNPVNHQAVWFRTGLLRSFSGFDTTYALAADYKAILQAWSEGSPARWSSIDVDYEAGGASDTGYRSAIAEMARARRDVLGAEAWPVRAESLLERVHSTDVALRHAVRRSLMRSA